jgi:hypothetical protein
VRYLVAAGCLCRELLVFLLAILITISVFHTGSLHKKLGTFTNTVRCLFSKISCKSQNLGRWGWMEVPLFSLRGTKEQQTRTRYHIRVRGSHSGSECSEMRSSNGITVISFSFLCFLLGEKNCQLY